MMTIFIQYAEYLIVELKRFLRSIPPHTHMNDLRIIRLSLRISMINSK